MGWEREYKHASKDAGAIPKRWQAVERPAPRPERCIDRRIYGRVCLAALSHTRHETRLRLWRWQSRYTCLECTASSSTCSSRIGGGSGSMTLITTKCSSRLHGATAVHFVSKSHIGLSKLFRAD